MSRIAIFIDAGYFQVMSRDEFKSPRIDFGKLAAKIAGGKEILRTYYYDCLPYQSNPPTADEADRFSRRQRFHYALDRNPRFQVRLGRLEFRGKTTTGEPIFEQKRVDILMGVDLALLAAKHQITDAAISWPVIATSSRRSSPPSPKAWWSICFTACRLIAISFRYATNVPGSIRRSSILF